MFRGLHDLGIQTAKVLIITGREDTGRLIHGMLRLGGYAHTRVAAGIADILSLSPEYHAQSV